MAKAKQNGLWKRLATYRQINLTVLGRKTGQKISIPVWFAIEDEKVYLLPVHGSDTQWYRNVLKSPAIWIEARGEQAEFRAVPIRESELVRSVIARFREKYGAADVKRYYSKFDVAVLAKPA